MNQASDVLYCIVLYCIVLYCIVLYCIVRHAHGLMHLVACPETLEECRSRRRIG